MDWQPDDTQVPPWPRPVAPPSRGPVEVPPCWGPPRAPPPTTEHELLLEFYRQQNQIQELREELNQKMVSAPPPISSAHNPSLIQFVAQVKICELEAEMRTSRTIPRSPDSAQLPRCSTFPLIPTFYDPTNQSHGK